MITPAPGEFAEGVIGSELQAIPGRGGCAEAIVALRRRLLLTGVLAAMILALPGAATAEQASEPTSSTAARIATGRYHTCTVLTNGTVRCWGYGKDGALGYGNPASVGDDETPTSVGPVLLGPGRTAKAITAGNYHTCAILDDGSVRCWGFGGDGRLGYGNTSSIGAGQTPGSAGPVNLGAGHTAVAITAGGSHTCAILDDGSVRCWGYGFYGQLGYGNPYSVGDGRANSAGGPDESIASVGPVDLAGHKATAITAGNYHTCAILDDGSVRCWGYGANGQLGYGNTSNVGDGQTPGSVGPVDLGLGRTAVAISAGGYDTCAILDDGSVRCWGYGANGELGYGNTSSIGDDETPASAGPVDLGPGRIAKAISAGSEHACAILDDNTVRCWGYGVDGQLGYASTANVADTPTTVPSTVGPVDLRPGRTAAAISAGALHTCAILDDNTVRCWGDGAYGRLGYCNQTNVGDDETPGSAGPVSLEPGQGGVGCAATGGRPPADPFHLQALRTRRLRKCLAAVAGRPTRQRRHPRTACIRRYGRAPGPIATLHARAASRTSVELAFPAAGSNGKKAPAARRYLIKQSRRPIRSASDFRDARPLCRGRCRFHVIAVGTRITLTITHLRSRSSYYYAVAALDNVSGRLGRRSKTAAVRTR